MKHQSNLTRLISIAVIVTGCDVLGPRTSDPMDGAGGYQYLFPAGTAVPAVVDAPDLANQIRTYAGLSSSTLMTGVIPRSPGKAGVAVNYWDFGRVTTQGSFAITGIAYVLADGDATSGFVPRPEHPILVDAIPGDTAYSPIRRLVYVPTTAAYAGELVTSLDGLAEALERGLVGDPVASTSWRDMPVVPTGMLLQVSAAANAPALEVYAHGYRVELFALGGALGIQPLRSNNTVLVGQEARLLSGLPTGMPPTLPTSPDAQPVFQYGIPSAAPAPQMPNYTPLVTEIDVRLADGKQPSDILADGDLFKRSGTGSMTGYRTDNVASIVVTTSTSNRPIQFVEGQP